MASTDKLRRSFAGLSIKEITLARIVAADSCLQSKWQVHVIPAPICMGAESRKIHESGSQASLVRTVTY